VPRKKASASWARFFMTNRDKKEKQVESLGQELATTKSIVLVDFAGMNVKLQQELKRRLADVGASMNVVKNTLLKLAFAKTKATADLANDEILQDQTAVILSSEDAISPIQVLGKFLSEFELPTFKVGIVEGSFQDKDSLTKIASLPSKEVLAAQVIGTLVSPMYGIVSVLNAKMQELVFVLGQAKGGDN